jgi:hypothetical protein
MKNNKRSFTIVKLSRRNQQKKTKKEGRYIARDAISAAKKAFNRECRESKIKGQCTLIILLKETTNGSKKKIYIYKMKRVKLKENKNIILNNIQVTYKYKINAHRIKELNNKEYLQKVKGSGKMSGGSKNIFTGFYNIISDDNIILYKNYYIYPKLVDEKIIYEDIEKKHFEEFKKSNITKDSIKLFNKMVYPLDMKNEIKEIMEIQLSLY